MKNSFEVELFDGAEIETEANTLAQKENLLKQKALQLEKEMAAIHNQKIDILVKQFEQQLLKDAGHDFDKARAALQTQYDERAQSLSAQKELALREISGLQKQIKDDIEVLRENFRESEMKRKEVEQVYEAALHHLLRDRKDEEDKHWETLTKNVAHRKEIFRKYVNKEEL